MEKYGVMLSLVNDEQRQLEVDQGIRCKHLPLHQTEYIINKDGRKVCDDCCDHSNEEVTGVYQWNGFTYCWLCCPHRITGKDFVEDLDGVPTCTMCWVIVPNRIVRKHEYNLYESIHSRCVKETSNEDVDVEFNVTTVTLSVLKGLAHVYGVRGYSKYTTKTRGELERLVYEAMNDEETKDMMKLKLKRILSNPITVRNKKSNLILTNKNGELVGKIVKGTYYEVKSTESEVRETKLTENEDHQVLPTNESKIKPIPKETTKCEHKNIVMEFMTGDYCCSDCWDRVDKPSKEYGPVKFYPGSRCPKGYGPKSTRVTRMVSCP